MATDVFCSTIARRTDEPLGGSASHARGCVLLSYPKRLWARAALGSAGLPVDLVLALESLADERDVVTRLVAHEGAWDEHVEITLFPQARRHPRVRLQDAAELFRDAGPEDGEPLARPLVAVCTHGVRDRCCARFGGEIVRAMRTSPRASEVEIREATHLGGDRFAPTLLVLPSGHTYGHLETHDAARLVAAVSEGRVLPERFRGTLWRDPLEQLAELVALERALAIEGEVECEESDDRAILRCSVRGADESAMLEVRCRRARRLVVGDCRSADRDVRAPVWRWITERVTVSPRA